MSSRLLAPEVTAILSVWSLALICCTKHVVVFTDNFSWTQPFFFHLIASISHIRSLQIKIVESKEMFLAWRLCSLYSPTEVSAHLLRAVWKRYFWAIRSLALMSALLWSCRKPAPEEFTLSTKDEKHRPRVSRIRRAVF